jgi:rubrerythrin
MTDKSHENQGAAVNLGEAVPLSWACTNCGYRVEGELPEKCSECGASKEEFVTPDATPAPVPTLTLTVYQR